MSPHSYDYNNSTIPEKDIYMLARDKTESARYEDTKVAPEDM